MKRTEKETWADVEFLQKLIRSGKYPRGVEFLGEGSGNFYQCAQQSVLRLRVMKRKTKQNAKEWTFHDDRIRVLMQIARIMPHKVSK